VCVCVDHHHPGAAVWADRTHAALTTTSPLPPIATDPSHPSRCCCCVPSHYHRSDGGSCSQGSLKFWQFCDIICLAVAAAVSLWAWALVVALFCCYDYWQQQQCSMQSMWNWYFMIGDDDDDGVVVFVVVSLLSQFVDPVWCHHSSMMCWCVGGTEKIIVHSQTPSIMNYRPENDILRLNSLPRCFWSRIAISNILTITIVNIMLGNQVGLGA